MSIIANVEKQALSLTAKERGELITKLLQSLPVFPTDADGGVSEAKRRSDELRKNPEIGITVEELDRRMRERSR